VVVRGEEEEETKQLTHVKDLLFLYALATFPKATATFVSYIRLSVRLSFRIEQLSYHWRDFREIWYLSIFRKSVENIQISLKLTSLTVNLHEDQYIFMTKSRPVILILRNVLDKFVEKIKTHTLCSTTFPENRAF
jgi:hypothetical protein